jgi:pimeloyl-ACP methyl ester carboxylesterase
MNPFCRTRKPVLTTISEGDYQASVNGVQLAYSVVGSGKLLLAPSPGWGIGATYLRQGVAKVLDGVALLCIDTRGSGRSGSPADPAKMSTADMADDIEHLRRHLGLETIDLFGHSNAGAIAIAYAQRYPATCRKLVLANSQLIGFPGSEATQRLLAEWADDPRYRDAIPHFGKPFPFTDQEFTDALMRFFPLYFHDPVKNMQRLVDTIGGPLTAWAAEHQWAADARPGSDQVVALDRIRAQTLILVGRHDFITPVPVAERIQAGIKGSTLVVLEGSGHMGWIEEPARFAELVTRFLRGV